MALKRLTHICVKWYILIAVTGLLLTFFVSTVVFRASFVVRRIERAVLRHDIAPNAPLDAKLGYVLGCVRKYVMVSGPAPTIVVKNLVFSHGFLSWNGPSV